MGEGDEVNMYRSGMSEIETHKAVVMHLRAKYPKVLFHSDFGSGVKLTQGQANVNKAIQKKRGWPDLFLPEPRGNFHGLFLELKKEGAQPFKKGGDLKDDDHLREQNEWLEELRERGYHAQFAVGLDEAVAIIDAYLSQD